MRLLVGRRVVWLSVLFLVCFGALAGRLYNLQIVKAEAYSRVAYQQRRLHLPVASRRGLILDRNGRSLTDPQSGWGVAAFPPLMRFEAEVIRALSPMLGVGEIELHLKLPRREDPLWRQPVWLAPSVSEAQAARIRALKLPGIVVAPVGIRYGSESLARHLIGYVNEQGGQLGLESAFEQHLAGDAVPAYVAYLDGRKSPLAGLGVRAALPTVGKEPYHLYTTLDARIQQVVESVLDAHRHPDGGALRGAAIVLDARAGDVLAMASRPDYDQRHDPNLRVNLGDDFLMNRAVSPFEPGSVFKAVVAAAAMDEGLVKLTDRFYCPGHYEVGGQRFTDGDGKGHGWITFKDAIAKSCNVTFAHVGYRRMGADRLLAAAQKYGLGVPTELGLPEEQPGTLPPLRYGGEVAQFAFGQGLLVTPVQVARAFAAIANDGVLPALKLVTAVKNPDGKVMYRPPSGQAVRVMSAATARQLLTALSAVTDPKGVGTGRRAWVSGGGASGKTGSAEGTENGAPTVHAWFAGFVPAQRPRLAIVVLVQGGGSGGLVAAPLFRSIGEGLAAIGAY